MSIQYTLRKNNLTPNPSDYAATVKTRQTFGFEEIAEEMIRQGSTVNQPDILAVLSDAVTACTALLLRGNRVLLGDLVQLFPRIKGVFNSAGDTFDPSRHMVDVGANPGRGLRQKIRQQATTEKMIADPPKPILVEYLDVATGTLNERVTPGDNGKLSGKNLKSEPGQSDEGLFFVPTGGGTGIQVTSVTVNDPGSQIFLNPDLASGTYNLEVRTRMFNGSELRVGRLDRVLTVA